MVENRPMDDHCNESGSIGRFRPTRSALVVSATVIQPRLDDVRGAPGNCKRSRVRTEVRNGQGVVFDLVPDFHFIAPNGNATLIHRQLIDTSGNFSQNKFAGWKNHHSRGRAEKGCSGVRRLALRCLCAILYNASAPLIMPDADGNRSNPVDY